MSLANQEANFKIGWARLEIRRFWEGRAAYVTGDRGVLARQRGAHHRHWTTSAHATIPQPFYPGFPHHMFLSLLIRLQPTTSTLLFPHLKISPSEVVFLPPSCATSD